MNVLKFGGTSLANAARMQSVANIVISQQPVLVVLSAISGSTNALTEIVEAIKCSKLALAEQAVADVIAERERLIAVIRDFPFVKKVWPSDANFFLILVDDAELVMQRAAEHKVLLRFFGDSLPGCIRISVGSREDSKRLLHALETLVEIQS